MTTEGAWIYVTNADAHMLIFRGIYNIKLVFLIQLDFLFPHCCVLLML